MIVLTKDKSGSPLGVVAALALVPAASAAGFAFLSLEFRRCLRGLMLRMVNLVVTIVASIVTLWILRPDRTEQAESRTASIFAEQVFEPAHDNRRI